MIPGRENDDVSLSVKVFSTQLNDRGGDGGEGCSGGGGSSGVVIVVVMFGEIKLYTDLAGD